MIWFDLIHLLAALSLLLHGERKRKQGREGRVVHDKENYDRLADKRFFTYVQDGAVRGTVTISVRVGFDWGSMEAGVMRYLLGDGMLFTMSMILFMGYEGAIFLSQRSERLEISSHHGFLRLLTGNGV